MYGFHIFILPLVVAAMMGIHLTLVRLRGVVKPYDAPATVPTKSEAAS
jgi:quinol-cytochrome oxidoreductase complex cytochrome b subunit